MLNSINNTEDTCLTRGAPSNTQSTEIETRNCLTIAEALVQQYHQNYHDCQSIIWYLYQPRDIINLPNNKLIKMYQLSLKHLPIAILHDTFSLSAQSMIWRSVDPAVAALRVLQELRSTCACRKATHIERGENARYNFWRIKILHLLCCLYFDYWYLNIIITTIIILSNSNWIQTDYNTILYPLISYWNHRRHCTTHWLLSCRL